MDVTVAEDVASTVTNIDREKVAACLAKAGLTKVIADLPHGMDTMSVVKFILMEFYCPVVRCNG